MKYCLSCSSSNPDDQIHCRVCNGIFFSNIISRQVEEHISELVCSGCKREVSQSGLVCPHCGFSIQDSLNDTLIRHNLKLKHHSGHVIILTNGDVVGKDFQGKEILKNDPYVSGSHIKVKQTGKYFKLTDISSGNSFFVNMVPVPVRGSWIVENKDSIKIGTTDFMVEIC